MIKYCETVRGDLFMQAYLLCKDTPLTIYIVENNSITLEKILNKPSWLYSLNADILNIHQRSASNV